MKRKVELSRDTRKRIEVHISNLGSADEEIGMRAEDRLIRFREKAVDSLIEATLSRNPVVRFRAVWALAKIGDTRAYDYVVRLTNDVDHRVSYDAIMAIGELGDKRAIPLLNSLATLPPDEHSLDSAAGSALVKLGAVNSNDQDVGDERAHTEETVATVQRRNGSPTNRLR